MRALIVAATAREIAPLIGQLAHDADRHSRLTSYTSAGHEIDVLITGVGMVATAAWTPRELIGTHYDLALNLGVCGSFNPGIPPGTVVHVVSDRLAELGAEDGDAFLTIQQMGLLGDDEAPFTNGRLVNSWPPANAALAGLQKVDGVTVNTVHGHEPTIALMKERFNPDVESMEGAAFMYVCLIHGVPFAQVRAVSNIVERRNRAAWKLDDAVRALNAEAWRILQS